MPQEETKCGTWPKDMPHLTPGLEHGFEGGLSCSWCVWVNGCFRWHVGIRLSLIICTCCGTLWLDTSIGVVITHAEIWRHAPKLAHQDLLIDTSVFLIFAHFHICIHHISVHFLSICIGYTYPTWPISYLRMCEMLTWQWEERPVRQLGGCYDLSFEECIPIIYFGSCWVPIIIGHGYSKICMYIHVNSTCSRCWYSLPSFISCRESELKDPYGLATKKITAAVTPSPVTVVIFSMFEVTSSGSELGSWNGPGCAPEHWMQT